MSDWEDFKFGGLNFANSAFQGFSLNAYAEEQVCQITTRVTPTPAPRPSPKPTPTGRVVDLSDDVLVEEPMPNARVIEES